MSNKSYVDLMDGDTTLIGGMVDGYNIGTGYISVHYVNEDGGIKVKAYPFVSGMSLVVDIPPESVEKEDE